MTNNEFREVIKVIKQQIAFEEEISRTIGKLCPDSYPPIVTNPIWKAVEAFLDDYVGEKGFAEWWLWETECGLKCSTVYFADKTSMNIRNYKDIIRYKKKLEELKAKQL